MLTYNPSTLVIGARSEFWKGVEQSPKDKFVDVCAMRVDSKAASENYAWVGEAPIMKEMIDQVEYFPLSDSSYTLENKEYAAAIEIKEKDLKNDQTGGIRLRINQLGNNSVLHPRSLLITALTAGITNTGYDSYAVFGNSHPARGQQTAVQDNLLAGAGTSTDNVATDINQVLAYFYSILAENNEPMNPVVTDIAFVFPPLLMKAFKEATGSILLSNTSNVQLSGMRFWLFPEGKLVATDANDWYALNVSSPSKTLVYQVREPLSFIANESGDNHFNRHVFAYQATAQYVVGYGAWQQACKVVNT